MIVCPVCEKPFRSPVIFLKHMAAEHGWTEKIALKYWSKYWSEP